MRCRKAYTKNENSVAERKTGRKNGIERERARIERKEMFNEKRVQCYGRQ